MCDMSSFFCVFSSYFMPYHQGSTSTEFTFYSESILRTVKIHILVTVNEQSTLSTFRCLKMTFVRICSTIMTEELFKPISTKYLQKKVPITSTLKDNILSLYMWVKKILSWHQILRIFFFHLQG